MNAPKFTHGPWKCDSEDPRYIRSVKTKEYIAARQSSNSADQRLIAAAPELYEALDVAVTSMLDSGYPESHAAVRQARDALAKAVSP